MPPRLNIETIAVPVGKCPSGGKLRWPSEEVAHRALKQAQKRSKTSRVKRRVEKRAYPCSRCNGWHLTSQERAA